MLGIDEVETRGRCSKSPIVIHVMDKIGITRRRIFNEAKGVETESAKTNFESRKFSSFSICGRENAKYRVCV